MVRSSIGYLVVFYFQYFLLIYPPHTHPSPVPDQTLNRKRILDEESRKRFVESELRERRLRDLEQLQRDRDLEEALLARRADEIKVVMDEENQLRMKLSELEEERQKDRRIEMQLLAREHELHKKASVENVMRSADQRLVNDIRGSKKVSLHNFF